MTWRQKILCLLICFLLFQGCFGLTANVAMAFDPSETSVKMLLQKKEQAINKKKRPQFLAVIDQQNTFYLQEQKRWFADAIQTVDPNSYHLELLSIHPQKGDFIPVDVRQSYKRRGETHSVVLPLRFRNTSDGLKESDLDFLQLYNHDIVVSYTDPEMEESAYIALDTLQRAYYVMHDRYQWRAKKMEIKLYHQPEVFRQSVKPSLPIWAGGWNEAKQSIKLVITEQNPRQFASGIVHELTHQMVSDLTHDNAAYWLQEGAAMYYEAHLLPGLHEEIPLYAEDRKPDYSLEELKNIDLEKLPDRIAIKYYQSCYQLFRFLVDEYGEEKIKQVFSKLKEQPFIDQDTSEKRKQSNQITAQAVKQVLNVTGQQLDQKWQAKYK